MRLRRLFGAAIAAVLAAAAGSSVRRWMAGDLGPALPGELDTVRIDGCDVSMSVVGDPNGRDVLFVHDVYRGASGREGVPLVTELMETHNVVVMDLPGFGRSGRPPTDYDPEYHADAVANVVSDRLEEPIVVASGLGSVAAVRAAQLVDIDRLVLISPRERRQRPRVSLSVLLGWPVLGTAIYGAMVSKGALRRHLRTHLEVEPTRSFLDYNWIAAQQPGSRNAIAAWLAGDLDATVDLATSIDRAQVPVTLVGGDHSRSVPIEETRTLAEAVDAPLLVAEGTGCSPHLEAPEQLVDHLFESDLVQDAA